MRVVDRKKPGKSSLYARDAAAIISAIRRSTRPETPSEKVLNENILWLNALRLTDLARVGGKNSSLGEMIGQLSDLGVSVPGGFATTSDAFKAFIAHNTLHRRI